MFGNCRTFLGLMLLAGALAADAAPESVALVTELSGPAALVRKTDSALELLDELRVGAIVSLGNGARAVVVHTASGVVYDLSGPGRFRVQGKDIEALNGARLARRELPPQIKSFQLKPLSAMQANIIMRGGTPMRLDGPNGGVLGTDELDYRIRGSVIAPRVEVTAADGTTIIAAQPTSAIFNPASAAPIAPGTRYLILIKGTDSRGKPVELSSGFWLIDNESAARLKAAKPVSDPTATDLVIYALALERAGATATAEATWRAVNERRATHSQR
jgi:hypothetical protein